MAQTNVNIRMDEELKKQFDKFCQDVGMTMTTAICVFVKKAVREQRIPFEIESDPFYSSENMKRLKESIQELKSIILHFHKKHGKTIYIGKLKTKRL